jgi:serine/threonine protein kinase
VSSPDAKLFACKIVDRKGLEADKEQLVVNEINNQDVSKSNYVVSLKKAIKTDNRYYIFIEFCNGNDLKVLMEMKQWRLPPFVVQKMMK